MANTAQNRYRLGLPYLVLSLLAAVFISGCLKVGPDFQRPEAPVSPAWVERDGGRVRNEPADFRAWWKVFNDPVLDRLMDMAYGQNPSLQIAGTRVLQARAQLGIVTGEFYPQTQAAAGSLQWNRSSKAASFGSGLSYTEAQVGANISWELDFWGRFRRAIESADAGWFGSLANYDNTLVSLTADVANSYIQIRTLEKRIEIANQNALIQRENLGIAEARFQFGLVSELDVEQARTALNSTLSSIPPLEAQLGQSNHALCLLLGVTPGSLGQILSGSSGIPVAPAQVAAGIPADLLRRRPDIRMAEYQAAAQCARIGVAKADLYPAFTLSGFFGFLSTDVAPSRLGDIAKWSSRTYQAGPSIQWNILNYGRITNNVRLQDAVFQEYLVTYENAVLSAQKDVEDNLIAFARAQDGAALLARSAAAAGRALDLAVLQYQAGARDFTTVITAQQALLTQQDSLASTLGTLSSSVVGVYRALGGGWEIREGRDLIPPGMKSEMASRLNWGELLSPKSYNPLSQEPPKHLVRPPDW
ncbi:MAG: efflux transporter outer membrane subunit [Syntrophaceae bacterium]